MKCIHRELSNLIGWFECIMVQIIYIIKNVIDAHYVSPHAPPPRPLPGE